MNNPTAPQQHQQATPPPTHTSPVPPPPPAPPAHHEKKHGVSVWRIVIGAFIILFGLQLLASNFGWDWAWSVNLWQLWPVFIILIGLSMLTKGRGISTGLAWVFGIVLVGGMVLASVFGSTGAREMVEKDLSIGRAADATTAKVSIDMGAAKVDVRGGASNLVDGTFRSNVSDLTVVEGQSAGMQTVELNTTSQRNFWFFSRFTNALDLKLSNDLPMTLEVDSGAADLDLDLSTVQVERLDIDSGASSVTLTMGATLPLSTVGIDSGAASLSITLPAGVGVHLVLDAGASSKTLPTSLAKVDEDEYETEGYDTAEKKIALTINSGASSITIHQN